MKDERKKKPNEDNKFTKTKTTKSNVSNVEQSITQLHCNVVISIFFEFLNKSIINKIVWLTI